MSSRSESGATVVTLDTDGDVGPKTFRLLAIVGIAVLTASYVWVLYDTVTSVVGGTGPLFALVAGLLLAATVLAYAIRPRTALLVTAGAVGAGFTAYLDAAGVEPASAIGSWDELLTDTLTLATGLPVLRMVEAQTWTLGFVAGPVFLSWYLVLRERYVSSVVPGGAALLFLVLTGNAEPAVTLVGTLAAVGAVAFGELHRRGSSIAQGDIVAIVFALIIAVSLVVAFIPASETGDSTLFGDAEPTTLEGTIDSSPDRSGISGSVELSPETRFTVESEEPSYWRTGVYDRFTGDEWIRTGESRTYDGELEAPPGEYETVEQHVDVETEIRTMPTAAQPVAIEGSGSSSAQVTNHGDIYPAEPLVERDSYVVESAVLDPTPAELDAAGTEYPDAIEAGDYRQLPDDTSSEFEQRTGEIVADAETPFQKAVAIESYLRSSKSYSLEVEKPSGNVAEAFLLEMDEGYCVYFATAMTQMLRAEDVPARYVTGYSQGEQAGDDEWVVRGSDAHAWVEVYFPDHGWVEFEPTPAGERSDVHDTYHDDPNESESPDDPEDELPSDGEDDDRSDVPEPGNDSTDGVAFDPGYDDVREADNEFNGSSADSADEGSTDEGENDTDDGTSLPSLPLTELAVGLSLLGGLVAGVYRTSAVARARRRVALYWHGPRGTPTEDVERAYRRLEVVLERRYRPRHETESVREYLESIAEGNDLDPRVERIARSYERGVYGGEIGREQADETVELVDELVYERLPGVERTDR